MNDVVADLLERIAELERQLAAELRHQGRQLRYRLVGTRVVFSRARRRLHRRLRVGIAAWLARSRLQSLISIPFIYGMALPLVLLDLSISAYQYVCFPLYRIAIVRRREFFVLDRGHLAYLNGIEKLHCTYCSYANGLLAYAREITARTEQYWCPIRHARRPAGAHARYARFIAYGDHTDYHARAEHLRRELDHEREQGRRK